VAETPLMHWQYPDDYQPDWFAGLNGHVQLFEAIDAAVYALQVSNTGKISAGVVDARGDLIVAWAADSVDRFGVGGNGQVLTADSTQTFGLRWVTPAGAPTDLIPASILTSKGDLIGATGASAPIAVPIAANGLVLTANSAAAAGFSWAILPAPAAGSITDAMLRNSAATSVIGRSANSVGPPADIVGSTIGHVLRLAAGPTLAFGPLNLSDTNSVTGTLPGTSIQAPLPAANIPTPANNSITNAILRDSAALSVIGRSVNSLGDPADIAGTLGQVLRIGAGPVLAFGALNLSDVNAVTGTLPGTSIQAPLPAANIPAPANDSITDAMFRNSAALSVIGRSAATLGDPADIAGTLGQVLRVGAGPLLGFGAIDLTSGAAVTGVLPSTNHDGIPKSTVTAKGDLIAGTGTAAVARLGIGADGQALVADSTVPTIGVKWATVGGTGIPPTIVDVKGDLIAASAADTVIRLPSSLVNGDVLTVSTGTSTGLAWAAPAAPTVADNSITDLKLRDSAGASVIGKATTGTGDPADITSSADGQVLRRSGTGIGWGTVATLGITDDAVTDAKLRNSGALSVIGRSANSAGDPADMVGTLGQVLRVGAGPLLGFGALDLASAAAITGLLPGANIADDAITNAKLRNSVAVSVIGNAGGSTTDPADIVAGADGAVLRRVSASVLGFGTVDTAGITDAAVTSAKLRNSAPITVIGRSANSTGVPADIQATADGQVLRRAASALGFGAVDLASASAVTGVLPLANLPPRRRFIGAVIADSTVITNVAGNQLFDKSVSIPANTLVVGSVVEITYRMLVAGKASGAGALTCFVFVGGELLGYSDMVIADGHPGMETMGGLSMSVRTIGSTGTIFATYGGFGSFSNAAAGYKRETTTFNQLPAAINTTIARAVQVGINFTVVDPGNQAKLQNLNLWIDFPEATVS
jgi:Repeat of unknown function (DUF5907)